MPSSSAWWTSSARAGISLARAAIDDRSTRRRRGAWRCGRSPWRRCRRRRRRRAGPGGPGVSASGFVGAHQVDAGEVLVGRVDALEVLARDVHEDRQAGAVGDEDRVELLAQLGQGVGPADDRVAARSSRRPPRGGRPPACDDLLGQAELGDAVDEHAARLVEGLEDGDVVAALGQLAGGGQAGRAGADDGTFLPLGGASRGRGAAVVCRAPSRRRSARGSRWRPACPSCRGCSRTSHWVSCGQTRPVTQGRALSPSRTAAAPAGCPRASSSMKRGMLTPTGQPSMHFGLLALEAALGLEQGQLLGQPEVDLVEVARRGRAESCSGMLLRGRSAGVPWWRASGPHRSAGHGASMSRSPVEPLQADLARAVRHAARACCSKSR